MNVKADAEGIVDLSVLIEEHRGLVNELQRWSGQVPGAIRQLLDLVERERAARHKLVNIPVLNLEEARQRVIYFAAFMMVTHISVGIEATASILDGGVETTSE
jgi:hypothetical protein